MNPALLVIDVQQGLFAPEPRPFEADAVMQRINELARSARQAGRPVVFIQHERADSPLSFQSPGWQLAAGLETAAGDLFVRKTTPDSFLNTDLQALLESRGVKQVVITGYACEFCVDTTTRRAAALGYEVVLAADAHTTHDKLHLSAAAIREHENATLPGITSFGPRITSIPAGSIAFAA